jgi:putative phosphoribosyl transferase
MLSAADSNHSFLLFGGSANPALAAAVARELGVRLGACRVSRFPDGEVQVRLEEPVRGGDVFQRDTRGGGHRPGGFQGVLRQGAYRLDRTPSGCGNPKHAGRPFAQRTFPELPDRGAHAMSRFDREYVTPAPFRNRTAAGRLLARKLGAYAGRGDVLVLGLPRGGVPVAFEVARALKAPLDVFLVRKLGLPGHEELAMGAIASGGVCTLNDDLMQSLHIPDSMIQAVAAKELSELKRREQAYRDDRPAPEVRDRIVIVVDDGLATGATMRAAVAALRRLGPERIVVAVPTAAPSTRDQFAHEADECVCVMTPEPFHAVGVWYDDFSQTTDEQVRDLLAEAAAETMAASGN